MARRDTNDIGAKDLQTAIRLMSRCQGWEDQVLSSPTATTKYQNERIATGRLSEVLLARWLMFDLFIKVARNLNEGNLDTSIQQKWLLFQTVFPIKGVDLFSALQCLFPLNGGAVSLERSFGELSPKEVLGDAFNPSVATFFYVLDEAQDAGDQHIGAFVDAMNFLPRPVLRLLVRHLIHETDACLIISGTGFSLELFKSVLGSSVGKKPIQWFAQYKTGDFSNNEMQSDYFSQFFPSSFAHSSSGELLKSRIYEWLRGRYVEVIVSR